MTRSKYLYNKLRQEIYRYLSATEKKDTAFLISEARPVLIKLRKTLILLEKIFFKLVLSDLVLNIVIFHVSVLAVKLFL